MASLTRLLMKVSRSTSGRLRNEAAHAAHSTNVGPAVPVVLWVVIQSRIRRHLGRRETSNSTGFWLGARLAIRADGGAATPESSGVNRSASATPIAAPNERL